MQLMMKHLPDPADVDETRLAPMTPVPVTPQRGIHGVVTPDQGFCVRYSH